MSDEILEFEENPKYAPDGYWPEGTLCPRRAIEGRVFIENLKQRIIDDENISKTLEELQGIYSDVHRSDLIDAKELLI